MPIRRRAPQRTAFTRTLLLVAAVSAFLAACSDGDNDADLATPPGPVLGEIMLPMDEEPIGFERIEVPLLSADGDNHTLTLEVADTFDRRTRGLQYRTSLPANSGMLFAFPADTAAPFWNKDAPLDLDLALLDADGAILEITQLAAWDPSLLQPDIAYRFAVQLPAGWFARNNVGINDRFAIPAHIEGLAE